MSDQVKLTDEASIPVVVQAMTTEEKALLVAGATAFQTNAIERLGIPAFVPADGHNGINFLQLLSNIAARVLERQGTTGGSLADLFGVMSDAGAAGLGVVISEQTNEQALAALPPDKAAFLRALTDEIRASLPEGGLPSCFPPGIVMGATWNPELVGQCGRAVAREAKSFGVDMLLGPNVNIHRDPLGGRVFESYSEDPYLASKMVIDYVRGVQSEGIAADVKHFAANNQETLRQGIDTIVPERALREIYLPAFRAAIQEGDCWTVMSAYNKINGSDCALNARLLTEILRDEWGFEGFVVSDWGAAYDRIEALKAGNDLEMPGPQNPQVIVEAIESGDLDEFILDERVANILSVLLKLPAFVGKDIPPIDRPFSARIARDIAVEGAVLLKNSGGVLPLATSSILAIVGENARNPIPTGGGSAGVEAPYTISLLQGLEQSFQQIVVGEPTAGADAAIVAVGQMCGEGRDRESLKLPDADVALIKSTAARCREMGIPCIAVLNVGGPLDMRGWLKDVDAVLLIWFGGMELGHAAADLLSGARNPSGKLPLTFPKRHADTPSFLNFPGEFGEVRYGEGIFVGYRYYDTKDVEPQFPFGYGLSYTDFEISNLNLSSAVLSLDAGEQLSVFVDVTNVGARQGQETIQLYIHDVASTPQKPQKELKGFAKVSLAPGETTTVSLDIGRQSLAHYDPDRAEWCVEPGLFEVLVSTSSAGSFLSGSFRASGFNPYGYGPTTPFETIMADDRAIAVLARHLPPQLATREAMALELRFMPHNPLERVWMTRFEPILSGLPSAEKAQLKKKLYNELAEIDIT